MATVLITDANRGLGLEFYRQYATEGWHVLACCRNPEAANELTGIPHVRVRPLDVSNFSQIDCLAAELKNTAVDILINNAGIFGDSLRHSFGRLYYAAWTHTLVVNWLALVKSLALDLEELGIGILALHPGWVKTDMGGANALIGVEESIAGMRRVIDRFTLSQSGSFFKIRRLIPTLLSHH